MAGRVGPGWLHNEISVRHRELNPDTVAHISTNRARRRLTSLTSKPMSYPLRQTTSLYYELESGNKYRVFYNYFVILLFVVILLLF